MGRLGNVRSNHAPRGNSLDSRGFHVMGTMGMMFPCVSLVEKNDVFPIQEILPTLPSRQAETFPTGYVFS